MGILCDKLDRDDEALQLFREVVEVRRRTLGSEHPQTHESLINLASFAVTHDQAEGAMDWLAEAVEHGFSNADWLAEAGSFQPLHGPEFDALVERARENATSR